MNSGMYEVDDAIALVRQLCARAGMIMEVLSV